MNFDKCIQFYKHHDVKHIHEVTSYVLIVNFLSTWSGPDNHGLAFSHCGFITSFIKII